MTIALMIDIETLSLRPDAYVTQVGYCVANLDTGEYLAHPTAVWLGDVGQYDRHKDTATIRWWMQQDKDVAAGVFGSDDTVRLHPFNLFDDLAAHITEGGVEEVWASPAMFDLPILTGLWDGLKPWKYNQERCMMTLYKRIDPHGVLAPPSRENHHDAAADALWQMEYLTRLHGFMRDNAMRAAPPPLEALG